MPSSLRLIPARAARHGSRRCLPSVQTRKIATEAAQKQEGTIAAAFASLSEKGFTPLEPRFATVKQNLISGHEDAVRASWVRLLDHLQTETAKIESQGSDIVPQINFDQISHAPQAFEDSYRQRGVAVVRGVIPEADALEMKESVKRYIAANPSTKAFPPDDPQVYELYWSRAQLLARTHPNMLATHSFLLNHWHSSNPTTRVAHVAVVYADRLRIRQPGDASFALGPHIDGGGPERWEPEGYGRAGTYDPVFRGEWESCDPWESSKRVDAQMDLYAGTGACSLFRMSQGWLGLSHTGAREGTLLVNPLLGASTAYFLLRPFFSPIRSPPGMLTGTATTDELTDPQFLAADNWTLETPASSWLHGATPGHCQELRQALHPHLRLDKTMIHIPTVRPGDYVAWHCDTIHAVDQVHAGKGDSSVMYIPAAPLTEVNAEYLKRQRDTFLSGLPPPDYGAGEGEKHHVGRPDAADAASLTDKDGMRAMGLERWESERDGLSEGEREMMRSANKMLGFAA